MQQYTGGKSGFFVCVFSFLEMFLSPFDLLLHTLAPRYLEWNRLSLILHFSSISTASYLSGRNLDQCVSFSGGAVHFNLLQLSALVFGCQVHVQLAPPHRSLVSPVALILLVLYSHILRTAHGFVSYKAGV